MNPSRDILKAICAMLIAGDQKEQAYFSWYALGVGGTMVVLILGFSLLSEGLQQRARRN